MRKIISKQEEGKKKRRNQFIIGGILIFIMLSSLLGYAFQSQIFNPNTTITYNGIIFTNQNGVWATGYENQKIAFAYNPSQIPAADLASFTKNINDFSNKSWYIYSYDDSAESELKSNLLPFAAEINDACPEGVACGQGIPVKTCKDNFIVIQNGSENVMQGQNCVLISGQGEDLIKLIDNVLFKIFGIRE